MPSCLEENKDKPLNTKSLVKLWINHYQRYDTLLSSQREEAYTKWENVMEKRSDIFNFGKDEVKELKELKYFLLLLLQ